MDDAQELEQNDDINDIRDAHENTLLHDALNRPDIDIDVVKRLLDMGLDVNARNKFGHSPLHFAVSSSDCAQDVVKLLLDRGASIDLTDNYGNAALHHILREADYAVIKLLIDSGADVNVPNNDGDSPLNHAVNNSKWGVFHLLPNAEQKRGVMDILKVLMERKPDVNLKNNFGDSPLHYAVNNCNRKQDLIRLLLRSGADTNQVNNSGESSLHRALNSCDVHPDVISNLLDCGASVNEKNGYGDDPLYLAVKNPGCTLSVLKLMLDRGADVLECNREKDTPLKRAIRDYERDESTLERVKLLIKYTLVRSLGYDINMLVKGMQHSRLLTKFASECTLEILGTGMVRVGMVWRLEYDTVLPFTLYEFLRENTHDVAVLRLDKGRHVDDWPDDEDPLAHMKLVLKVLEGNRFPLLNEVISARIKRSDMIKKLERQMMFTVRKGRMGDVVLLDFYSACCVARYLHNQDLLNWVMALNVGLKVFFRLAGTSERLLGKRSAEEMRSKQPKRKRIVVVRLKKNPALLTRDEMTSR